MDEEMVLCAASSYEQKYYLNPEFESLPEAVKQELQIMCVLYTADVGGVLLLVFDENGNLELKVEHNEGDFSFDEIGSVLKIKELQDFISRFSANASKSKQATSRKRALEKIELDEIKPSSRKYPYIDFRPNRDIGNEVLTVEGLSKTIDGVKILDNLTFTLNHDDKVAFVGGNELAKTVLFKILIGEMEPDEGTYKWGITTSQAYFPKDFGGEFDNDYTITEWLTQYFENKDATYVRGFLGRMLFSGEDGVKRLKVLSGGEKVRCLLSKMMISGANVLLLDEPTNHLDMESITALNNGMIKFPGVLLFTSRDHQIVQTTANRIMEIVPGGKLIDKITTYDEYLESDEMARKRQTYSVQTDDELEDFMLQQEIKKREPYVKTEPEIGRNDPCPCGSGKKYKKCCGRNL